MNHEKVFLTVKSFELAHNIAVALNKKWLYIRSNGRILYSFRVSAAVSKRQREIEQSAANFYLYGSSMRCVA